MAETVGKENPAESALAGETQAGSDSAGRLPSRIERYGKAKSRALEMQAYCKAQGDLVLAGKLRDCGNWLVFNHYYTVDKVRLAGASFCKKHLVCPLCAIRRGAKQLNAYLTRFNVIRAENEALRASLVTLTVKNGPDLAERLDHLREGLKILNQRRRDSLRGGHGGDSSEWSKILGLVGTFEVTRNQENHEWHPHCHVIVLHRQEVSEPHLSHEWFKITGDSFVVDVQELQNPDDPAIDFLEVFKYAIKFSELSVEDNLTAFHVLRERRLIFSAGLFWGVKVPEDLVDEPLDGLPFVQLFYRYLAGSGYSLEKVASEVESSLRATASGKRARAR